MEGDRVERNLRHTVLQHVLKTSLEKQHLFFITVSCTDGGLKEFIHFQHAQLFVKAPPCTLV